MQLCYVLLSPTFGMHQYTADLANRMCAAGHEVVLITTTTVPRDRYAPEVEIRTPIATSSTGFSREGLKLWQQRLIVDAVADAAPSVIHFAGPHLWNINLVGRLRRLGYAVIHTIHDLDPHHGMRMGRLLRIWNRLIIREADHILVHGQLFRQRLLQQGIPTEKVTYTPLLHLFVGYEKWRDLQKIDQGSKLISYEPFALFFGRLEQYKGVHDLLSAFKQLDTEGSSNWQLVIAGPGDLRSLWSDELPSNTILINRLIGDDDAVDLFSRCSVVVLPYTDATQSALIAAAYFFRKPVIVAQSGALTEYVVEGETGFIVKAGHPSSLARKLANIFGSPSIAPEMGQAGRTWYDWKRIEELETLNLVYAAYETER